MNTVVDTTSLSQDQTVRLCAITERFRDSWKSVDFPHLETFFAEFVPPEGDPLHRHALMECIALDLQKRWEGGKPVLLEQYQSALSEKASWDWPPEMIEHEFRVRADVGNQVELGSYQKRFPTQFPELQRRRNLAAWEDAKQLPEADPEGGTMSLNSERIVDPGDPRGSVVTSVGGYTLCESIGGGQVGEVWRSLAPGNVEVAIKIINRDSTQALTVMEEQSLELMKGLRHVFLLQIQAYWQHETKLFIVMELADGSLEERFEECRRKGGSGIPRDELIGYIREAAEAIDYLHSRDVLHRDIKPANILLTRGHVKVGDFGLARLTQGNMLVTARIMGTPHYMAPEVWKDNQYSGSSDQYALAATYFYLRVGRELFPGKTFGAVMQQHMLETPDLSELPPDEQQVLNRALAKNPKARYASCSEFAQALPNAWEDQLLKLGQRSKLSLGTWLVGIMAIAAVVLVAIFAVRNLIAVPKAPKNPTRLIAKENLTATAGDQALMQVTLGPVYSGEPTWSTAAPDEIEIVNDNISTRNGEQFEQDFPIQVPLNCAPGSYRLQVVASVNGQEFPHEFDLTVEPPDIEIPANFQPAANAILNRIDEDGNRIVYDRIVPRQHPTIEFRCIPRSHSSDPTTFYMSENLVTNELFAEFVRTHPQHDSELWRAGPSLGDGSGASTAAADNPTWPATSVSPVAASECAQWLGEGHGALPTRAQWFKASGYSDYYKRDGTPSQPTWKKGPFVDLVRVAIRPHVQGPVPVGSYEGDISPFGIRDMAGNVKEWALVQADAPPDFFAMMGRSWDFDVPMLFADYKDAGQYSTYSPPDDVGFRAVVESAE